MTEHKIVEALNWEETCFGCNGGSNEGIGMRSYVTEDGYIVGLCRTKRTHQAFPDTVHGGIVATYFDEVLWRATRIADPDTIAMTIEMSMKYLKAVPVDQNIRVVAEPPRIEGRHMYVDGRILLEDDAVAATASFHFLTVQPNHTLSGAVVYCNPCEEPVPESIRF